MSPFSILAGFGVHAANTRPLKRTTRLPQKARKTGKLGETGETGKTGKKKLGAALLRFHAR
jgi:hypothetical protein